MASTAQSANKLSIVKTSFANGLIKTQGIAQLSTGTVELDTGLSRVIGFSATCLGDTNTETVVFRVREDFPFGSSTITVDGTKVDEGQAVANAGSEFFCWEALGNV